jgi:hypothetical protein
MGTRSLYQSQLGVEIDIEYNWDDVLISMSKYSDMGTKED